MAHSDVILRILHFFYGLVLFLVGGFASFSAGNSEVVVSLLCNVPVGTFKAPDLMVFQCIALEINSTGIYSLVSSVVGGKYFSRKFFSRYAMGHFVVAFALGLMAAVRPVGITTHFLLAQAAIYACVGLITTVLLPTKEATQKRLLLNSWSQGTHAVYDLLMFILMNVIPQAVSPPISPDSELLVRTLGILLLMGTVVYGSSTLPDAGLWGFRMVSVFTRVNAVVFLGILALIGNADPIQFYVGSCDAVFAALILIDIYREKKAVAKRK